MATKEIVTSVVFTLVNGTEVTVTNNASKAYGDFTHGLPITDDGGTTYPYHAILFALPTFEEQEVDMTDNSCVGSSSGDDCDGDFKLTTPQGSFCINASDITGCMEYDEEISPSALIEGAVLTDGDAYTLNQAPTTYYVVDGILSVLGFAILENVDGGVRVYFTFAEGSSCDERVEDVTYVLTEHAFEVSYGGGGGGGPK